MGSTTRAGEEPCHPDGLLASASFCLRARISSKRVRDVSHDGRHADHLARLIPERHDREFERDAPSILSDSRNGKDVAVAVPGLPCRHHLSITAPVARPQPLRNDDVQRLADRIVAGMAEDTLRAGIPKPDGTVLVRGNDRIGFRAKHGISQHRRRNRHRETFVLAAITLQRVTPSSATNELQRGPLVQGHVIGLVALDLILGNAKARMVDVPL